MRRWPGVRLRGGKRRRGARRREIAQCRSRRTGLRLPGGRARRISRAERAEHGGRGRTGLPSIPNGRLEDGEDDVAMAGDGPDVRAGNRGGSRRIAPSSRWPPAPRPLEPFPHPIAFRPHVRRWRRRCARLRRVLRRRLGMWRRGRALAERHEERRPRRGHAFTAACATPIGSGHARAHCRATRCRPPGCRLPCLHARGGVGERLGSRWVRLRDRRI